MKRNQFLSAFITQWLLLFVQSSFADNPIIQTNYTADPAPMVVGDTVYLYTSHDEDYAERFEMNNWMLYTSTDMVNWTDHGIIASLKDFSWENGNAWAPQCIKRNGKFYLYCPLNRKGGNISVGVLVSDSPYGPFIDPLKRPLVTDNSPGSDYDPTVFIDDDGQAYLFFGGNGPCFYVKLNEDMISLSGSIQRANIDFSKVSPQTADSASFTEGPWLFKRDSICYLSWATHCCPEGIGYAMSDSFTGKWECKGMIMERNNRSSGNHPGIIEFKGKWYVFGFDYELLYSRIPYNPNKPERRSICVKEMTFNDNGTIKQVPWWGIGVPLPSVEQVKSHNPYDTTQAETICWSLGVRTEICKDAGGGMDVDSIHNNDYIKVKGIDFKTFKPKLFEARVASGANGGSIELHIDSLNGPKIGTCTFQGTGGWQTWSTKTCDVSDVSGEHDLFFKFTGGNGVLFNFNWWKFSPSVGIIGAKKGNVPVYNNNAGISAEVKHSKTLRIDFNQPGRHNNVRVDLFNVSGRLLISQSYKQLNSTGLSLSLGQKAFNAGMYLIRISINNKTVFSQQLCLQ